MRSEERDVVHDCVFRWCYCGNTSTELSEGARSDRVDRRFIARPNPRRRPPISWFLRHHHPFSWFLAGSDGDAIIIYSCAAVPCTLL